MNINFNETGYLKKLKNPSKFVLRFVKKPKVRPSCSFFPSKFLCINFAVTVSMHVCRWFLSGLVLQDNSPRSSEDVTSSQSTVNTATLRDGMFK